jgi:hypothetical protein
MPLRLIANGRVLTALAMLAIFAAATTMALGFPEKARLMPLMVGVPACVLALIQVFMEMRKAALELKARDHAESPGEVKAEIRAERRAEVQMFFWMFMFFIGILAFGFVYAAPLLVLGFLRFGKAETWKTAIFGAAGTWLVLYGFFEQAFEIPLFEGLLIEWFFG